MIRYLFIRNHRRIWKWCPGPLPGHHRKI